MVSGGAHARASSPTADTSALFAVLVAAGPFLLPVLGVETADVAFAPAAIVLAWAAGRCVAAARARPERRTLWVGFAITVALGALTSGIAVLAEVADLPLTIALYSGMVASGTMLVATLSLSHGTPPAPDERIDGLLVAGLIGALGIYGVAVPGFRDGDAVLALIFTVDLAALLLAAAAVVGRRVRDAAWLLLPGILIITVGDGVASAAASGQVGVSAVVTAGLWAVAGCVFGIAAERGRRGERRLSRPPDDDAERAYLRALFPLPVVLVFGVVGLEEVVRTGVRTWPIAFWGLMLLLALIGGFARQAYLVVSNRRAATRERRIRAEATRRNKDLEALTGLAATMAESLEEEQIVERGLEVLRLAARATSSALEVGDGDRRELRAVSGGWQGEGHWAQRAGEPSSEPAISERGRRQILRLKLASRDVALGRLTLIRPATDPFDHGELALLKLLAAQFSIALQNARAYREKLEQAIRDPLTASYNRRFFYDALEKEVQRHARYGSPVALVLFDIDDFKEVNDRFGHAAGDKVLRELARTVERIVRPADSFARIGGEEFALLLPETDQVGALVIAERVRSAVARHDHLDGHPVRISAGVAACPRDGHTAQAIERSADAALYWAKRNGKNLCAVASEVITSDAVDREHRGPSHLHALVAMIDDELRTSDHSDMVASYAVAIGQALGIGGERLFRLRRAALLHDIGKVSVPQEVLLKPAPLSEAELAEIRRHPVVGSMILRHAGLQHEGHWIRHHHERMDGSGYPEGLAGEDIPLESRILFVADAFEAMTSDRPYRRGMTVEAALAELGARGGTQFDPLIVETLTRVIASGDLLVAPRRLTMPVLHP